MSEPIDTLHGLWRNRPDETGDRRPKVATGVLVYGRDAHPDEEPSSRSDQGRALSFVRKHGIKHRLTYAAGVLDEIGRMKCSACGKIKAVNMDGQLAKHKIAGQDCPGSPTGEPIPVVITSVLLKGNGWGILTEDGKLHRAMLDGEFSTTAAVMARLDQLANS